MKQLVEENMEQDEVNLSLIDCYRVALDFGLPVAEKAIDSLVVSPPAKTTAGQVEVATSRQDLILPG